jgi:hypothetical protein
VLAPISVASATSEIAKLLNEIDGEPTGIFWG